MSISPLVSFAKFLSEHEYNTTMWENGITPGDANEVCHELTEWAKHAFALPGEFIVLWSEQDGIQFKGDNELAYAVDGTAYLFPSPFLEGESEGFVSALLRVLGGSFDQLFSCPVKSRVLFNAV